MQRIKFLVLGLAFCLILLAPGCKKTLEPGGGYAPAIVSENPDGTSTITPTSAPDLVFFHTDAAFRMSYSAVDAIFSWERDNRLLLWKLSPKIKHGLDDIRPTAVAVVQNYALARTAYKANPTPAGLDLLNSILSKMQQLQATASAVAANLNAQ